MSARLLGATFEKKLKRLIMIDLLLYMYYMSVYVYVCAMNLCVGPVCVDGYSLDV